MSLERQVAITGWGAVSSAGAGRAAHRDAIARSEGPRLTEVDRSAGYHRTSSGDTTDGAPVGSRHAALVDTSGFGEWLPPRAARRMSPPSRFAVVAARQALEQARAQAPAQALDTDDVPDQAPTIAPQTAVVTATAYGPASFTEELLRQIILESPLDASPFLFTEAVANAPAAQIALACTARGPNLTLTQREAGPLLALARGTREVASGRVDRALVAAVDEMNPILHAVLDRFGALAGSRRRGNDDDIEIARPFDRDRNGYIAAEGAACLCLEPLESARERGVPVLARVAASFAGFDCEAPVAGWSDDPTTLARVLARGLERADLTPEDIDVIVSGAAGSCDGDRLEALVLRSVWAPLALPPVVAPKAWLGEQGGALLAGAALAASGAPFASTPGFRHVDEALGVEPHQGGALAPQAPRDGALAPRRILVGALAPGGSAAWTVLETSPFETSTEETA